MTGTSATARASGDGEVLSFLQALWALDHAMQALSRRMHRRHGVTGPQRLLVRAIGREAGCSPGHAARLLHLHPATVTRLAARLAAAGLIVRRADPADGRRVQLQLTARGRRIDALRPGTVEAAVRQVLQETPRRRVEEVRSVLAALTGRLAGKAAPGATRGEPPGPRRRKGRGPA